MAMTLVEMAAGMKDTVVQGIVMNLARQSMLFQKIPHETIDSFNMKAWQISSVTDAVFRAMGSGYTETKDSFSEKLEGIYLLGGKIDIDRAMRLPGQSELDAYAENLLLQSERFRYAYTNTFVNGDRNVDPDLFDGLKVRVTAIGGSQVVSAATNGLDIGSSSANRQTFLDKIHSAMFEVVEGQPDLVLCSKAGYLSLRSVARREGLLDTTRDQFDRVVDVFAGVPFVWAGTKGDQTTEIITSTEDPGDGGNDATSYYFVRFGRKFLTGIQMHEPRRIFDDITDDGVTHRVVFEWPVGLAQFHDKSIVRLKDVIPL